jgi:hypothetical protein
MNTPKVPPKSTIPGTKTPPKSTSVQKPPTGLGKGK